MYFVPKREGITKIMIRCDHERRVRSVMFHCEREANFFYRIDYTQKSTYAARCIHHGVSPTVENRWIIEKSTYLISQVHET